MGEYARKPVRVQATQFWPEQSPWPEGVTRHGTRCTTRDDGEWCDFHSLPHSETTYRLCSGVVGASVSIRPGDWVITDWQGLWSVVSDAAFQLTYDPAPEAPQGEVREQIRDIILKACAEAGTGLFIDSVVNELFALLSRQQPHEPKRGVPKQRVSWSCFDKRHGECNRVIERIGGGGVCECACHGQPAPSEPAADVRAEDEDWLLREANARVRNLSTMHAAAVRRIREVEQRCAELEAALEEVLSHLTPTPNISCGSFGSHYQSSYIYPDAVNRWRSLLAPDAAAQEPDDQ